LQAVPGGFISMRYMENGHVTLPDNQKGKPENGGTVFVYGTTDPKEDEKIADVLQWTEDGQGGNKGGKLIATNDYDDGRCYEQNNSPIHNERSKSNPNYAMGQAVDGQPGNYPLFCETNVKIPETTEAGKPYTLYWVWQWPTAAGGIDPGYPKGKDEYYTTCIDVDVASADVAQAAEAESKFALGQQDAMAVAVKDFASRTALMTNAMEGEIGPVFSDAPSGAPSGTPSVAPSATGGAPIPTAGAPYPTVSAIKPKPSTPAPSSKAPAPSGTAPGFTYPGTAPSKPSATRPARSSTASARDSTAPVATGIPTLTGRPGSKPTSVSAPSGFVTITDYVTVTVVDSAAPTVPAAPTASVSGRAASTAQYGAKFRGRFVAA